MSGNYFFNAPIQLPNGSNIALENTLGNKLYFNSNSSMSSSYALTFPSSLGSAGQALITDADGNLSFETIAGVVSSLASNAIVNSSSGDIVFTTDSGNVNIGTSTGNVILTTDTATDFIQVISNAGPIIFNTNGNLVTGVNDSSNIDILIYNNSIGFNKPTLFLNNTESSNVNTGSALFSGGVGIDKNLNVGGTMDVTGNTTLSNLTVATITTLDTLTANATTLDSLTVTNDIIATNMSLSGNLTVNGTTTYLNSNVTQIEDPVILLGTSNGIADDSFDRGIIGKYYDGSSNTQVFFGWDKSEEHFTFIPNATVTNNTVSGSVGNAKFNNLDLTGSVTSNLSVSGVTTLNGNFVTAINEFSDSTSSTTDLWNGSNLSTTKHIMLSSTASSNYSSNALASTYINGQNLNLFFTNASGGTANATVDFGSNKLYSGTGLAQYLVFNNSGQSATLVYIDATGDNDGWRIINTGASVQ